VMSVGVALPFYLERTGTPGHRHGRAWRTHARGHRPLRQRAAIRPAFGGQV